MSFPTSESDPDFTQSKEIFDRGLRDALLFVDYMDDTHAQTLDVGTTLLHSEDEGDSIKASASEGESFLSSSSDDSSSSDSSRELLYSSYWNLNLCFCP